METGRVPIYQGEELLELDSQVRDHVHTTQALLTSLLGDAAERRHRLQGLRQRLGVPALASAAMSVEA